MPQLMPPYRLAEARRIATAGKWFVNCPDARCRGAERCRGQVRRVGEGGPRCYPDCLKLALTVMLAPDAASPADIEAMRRLLENDEALWHDIEETGPISASGALLEILTILAGPGGEQPPGPGAGGRASPISVRSGGCATGRRVSP